MLKKLFKLFKNLTSSSTIYKNRHMEDSYRNKYWRNKKWQYHRLDGPAIEYANGYKAWWVNGQRHRIDGPAIEYANGYKAWLLNGLLHRIDGPSREWASGYKEWWVNGENIDNIKNFIFILRGNNV